MIKRINLVLVNYLIAICLQLISAVDRQESVLRMEEQELIAKLLSTYSKTQKPIGSIQLKFALNLNQIVTIKAKDQIYTLNVFLDHAWTDKRLSWKPEENHNITNVKIDGEKLWTPDTFVYTTADKTGFLLPQKGAYFVVNHDGSIFWPNPLPQKKVRCSMAIGWFPYDDQLCTIVFGSWSNTMSYLNYSLMNEESALAGYQENSEWSLVEYKGYRIEVLYDNWIEKDPFSEIHYKIHIRRKPLFVLQNYALPATMLCTILLFLFYSPFPQQILLGINIMLTFSILKLKLSDDTPVQSDSIPLFSIYFTGCMFSALCAIFWFQQTNLYMTNKQIPKSLRSFILKFVCPLFRKRPYVVVEKDKSKVEEGQEGEVEEKRVEYTDVQLVPIINDYIFGMFVLYFLILNFGLLVILPAYAKPSINIDG